ncbi:hypothetical protein JTB14_035231 [Gonioctena quinquepunctata]|nr:hypothetical protein JTB14_035231 [Gonioctena quinquepunctata]
MSGMPDHVIKGLWLAVGRDYSRMTSTSFNIGMADSRNSSRVLKPPGGGHSDIFGIHDNHELSTPNKRKNQPQTSLNGCFAEEAVKPQNIVTEQTNDGEKEKKEEPATSRRVRVPPGGFSSGLW